MGQRQRDAVNGLGNRKGTSLCPRMSSGQHRCLATTAVPLAPAGCRGGLEAGRPGLPPPPRSTTSLCRSGTMAHGLERGVSVSRAAVVLTSPTLHPSPPPPAGRHLRLRIGLRRRLADPACVVLLVALVAGIEVAVRHAALRPLWYDELWRAHYLSVPVRDFWAEIRLANAPTALGWAVLSRGAAEVLGWHAWVLRLPQPLLAAGTYALTRRFTGGPTALAAGALLGVSGTIVDLGSQFKPYTIEAICAIGVLALWLSCPAGAGTSSRRLGRRTLAGALTVFTVPLAFLIGPLALADVLLVRGDRRTRLRTALEAAPAVLLTAAHALLFVARQSRQRRSHYWDKHFLAGRGLLGGLRFVRDQVVTLAGSAPPGVDRTDVNLVHTVTDGGAVETWVLAPAFALAFVLGAVVLLRRYDGRVVLFALMGAEAVELATSALRYWPFGPTRANLFLVPLLTLVPAVGISALVARARRSLLLAPAALALTLVAVVSLVSAASSTQELFRHQRDLRLIDQIGPATDAARRLARPGDLTVVAGEFVRPAWLYAMQVRADGPTGLRPIPLSETVFVAHDGLAAQRTGPHHANSALAAGAAVRARPRRGRRTARARPAALRRLLPREQPALSGDGSAHGPKGLSSGLTCDSGLGPRQTVCDSLVAASRMKARMLSCSAVAPRGAAGVMPALLEMRGMSGSPSSATLAIAHRENTRPSTSRASSRATESCRESRSMRANNRRTTAFSPSSAWTNHSLLTRRAPVMSLSLLFDRAVLNRSPRATLRRSAGIWSRLR